MTDSTANLVENGFPAHYLISDGPARRGTEKAHKICEQVDSSKTAVLYVFWIPNRIAGLQLRPIAIWSILLGEQVIRNSHLVEVGIPAKGQQSRLLRFPPKPPHA